MEASKNPQRPWLNLRTQLFVFLSLFCAADLFRQHQAFQTKAPEVFFTSYYHDESSQLPAAANDGICGILGSQSPMSLWSNHVENILRASQSPIDTNFALKDPTAQVLKIITPRLYNGLKSHPRDWQSLQNVVETTNRRLAYLKAKRDGHSIEEARPLRILVMGGSVTKGVGCKTSIKNYNGIECCWATRLETLLNGLVGDRVVDVHLAAVSATNSATGQVMLEYNLIPDEMREPDIIISAYSTNDMHIFTIKEAMSQNISLREKIFGMAQNFTRTALQQCTEEGNTPLLFWLDDYMGNEQYEILGTSEFIQGLQVLAGYYGFGLLSYADTVRDLVYGTTTERSFSPAGWYNKSPDMKKEIHSPYPMHIAVAYLFAYTFLELASTYCGLESWNVTTWENKVDYYNAAVPGLPDTRQSSQTLDTPPQPRPNGLPPHLDSHLKLDNISKLWKEARSMTCDADRPNRVRCPVGWISGFRPDHTTSDVMNYFQPYIQEPFEWEWRIQNKKAGWLPKSVTGATMTFKFPLEQEIHRLVLFYLKSYGEMWENSKAEIEIYLDEDIVDDNISQISLSGVHDKRASEIYSEEIILSRGASKTLRLSVRHTDGKLFKLMGFAICS
ncbi:hypothetical protein FisN_2Lh286 [Fistulifera solaris]|uniref:SGNH hydrolase-type esterase domain-containing protein n=1 Tax=Fistulifera solaris TaxID=1519565 RepID=A0A1Z5KFC9_FISSO|nr:hypothetical protein FisN_2Lh286 [Fistulifera solaris]|eukprot:GAX25003.1 hypothetical protein FisN_2Lh286 [Fistulifera solaris]